MTQESIENLFQSIDTIIDARMANLPYDQTIECEIINVDKASEGTYLVKYQASTFTAYSENKTFQLNDIVYVQIPQGDFTQDKFIVSKRTTEENKKVRKLPFLNFVKNTNLVNSINSNKEYIITTTSNGIETRTLLPSINLFYDDEMYIAGYTKVGIKLAFKTGIPYDMASGNYGIRLSLTGFDQTKTYLPRDTATAANTQTRETRTFELSLKDMIGSNFYNTLGYCNQEQVFDIKNFVVTNISLSLFQDGNFKSVDGINVNNHKIYATNIGVYFGYDLSEFYNTNYRTFLYTTDGLQYNSEYFIKPMYIRFAEIKDNKTNLNILNNQLNRNNIFRIHWEQYDPNEADIATWSELLAFNTLNGTEIIKEQELSTARNRLKHSYVVTIEDISTNKKYISNILNFENISYLEGSQLLDLLTGFQAEFAEETEGYNGRFFIYGQDSTSTNKIVSSNTHHIILSYNPSSDTDTTFGLQEGDIIEWTIPSENTMIEPVALNEYELPTIEAESKLLRFQHTIVSTDIDASERKFRIPYKIKDYYSNQLTNNIITFSLIRKDNKFNTQKELLFGTSGSQGNEYNMVIKLYKGNYEYVNAIQLDNSNTIYYPQLFVYDYDNKEIELDTNSVRWRLSPAISNLTFDTGGIHLNSLFDTNTLSDYIPTVLIGEWEIPGSNGEHIKAVYPIAIKTSYSNSTAISGSTVITYDITGKKPVYTKAPFEIDGTQQNIVWDIGPSNFHKPWEPILVNNCLIAPSIFHAEAEEQVDYYLTARVEDNQNLLWIQPIYMHQNKYPIGYEQPELNQLSFGNKTVKSTLVGQLKSGDNDAVSGIIMGVLSENNIDTLGLYAIHNNTEFFSINADGHVYLNGYDGTSESGAYLNINCANLSDIMLDGELISQGLTIKYNENNLFILDTDGNLDIAGTFPGNKISGTVANATNAVNATNATNAVSATSANGFTNDGIIHRNLQSISNILQSLGQTYTIITQ